MIENAPSKTAQRVAMRRAAHQLLDTPRVFDDPIALTIIGAAAAAELHADPDAAEGGHFASFLRAFMSARSRFAEDELAAAVRRGVRQYVILGAGLDTFAYRNPFPELRLFEVDYPATQGWKRERLENERIPIPTNLTFVPIDFERQSLGEVLHGAGFDPDAPAFFSWLGVTPYLEPTAVIATLRVIAIAAGNGGGVVFDYSTPPASMPLLERMGFEMLAARVKAAGEPFRSSFEPAALARTLREIGFSELEDLGSNDINARYFAGRADGLGVAGPARLMNARR